MATDTALAAAFVSAFSHLGCLARESVKALQERLLGSEPSTLLVPSDVLENAVGCLVLGALAAQTLLPPAHALYVGVGTGFCGCLTTFSGWMQQVSEQLTAGRVVRALVLLLAHLLVCVACYMAGRHLSALASELPSLAARLRSSLSSSSTSATTPVQQVAVAGAPTAASDAPPAAAAAAESEHEHEHEHAVHLGEIGVCVPVDHRKRAHRIAAPSAVALVSLCLAAAAALVCAFVRRYRYQAAAVCIAPAGALIRWWLSRFNAGCRAGPYWTFAVNISGSVVYAVLSLKPVSGASGRERAREDGVEWVLDALTSGFCGCLTTMSTFAGELWKLPVAKGYLYGLVSLAGTQLAVLPINFWADK
eukprot:m51a1_g2170 hypothetical protein (363) ;mRNA; f:66669-67880